MSTLMSANANKALTDKKRRQPAEAGIICLFCILRVMITFYLEVGRQAATYLLELLNLVAQLLQHGGNAHAVLDNGAKLADVDTLLFHRVTITQGNFVVLGRFMVNRYAERCTHGVLTTVALTDGILGIAIMSVEMELQLVHDLLGQFGQSVFLIQWEHGTLHGGQCLGQLQYDAALAILERLLAVRVTEHAEEHTVHADRSLDIVRHIALVLLGVKVLDTLTTELLVLGQVEVGT